MPGAGTPPGYDESVITVSALADHDGVPGRLGAIDHGDPGDTFAAFSNFGGVVDCGATGVGVLSTLADGGYGLLSGTSQSAPVVAGLASRLHPSGLHPEPVCLVR